MAYEAIKELVQYGLDKGLISEMGVTYAKNQVLDVMGMDEYEEPQGPAESGDLETILKELLDCAAGTGAFKEDSVTYRGLPNTKLMSCLIPGPDEVVKEFWERHERSPEKATGWYYGFSQDSDYIRRYHIARDMKQTTDTRCGTLDITINLSKPGKDPKVIATAKLAKQSDYPKCQLCMENAGHAGRTSHPARNNRRIALITINDSQWGFQYSPYAYYNEHCIVFSGQHVSTRTDKAAFRRLFDFTKQFPHYFLGSNADLSIVGGPILSHDHFQGGHYTFAMMRTPIEKHLTIKGCGDVEAGIIFWLMSVLQFRATDSDRSIELGDAVSEAWGGYTDEDAFIFAETDGEPHNTITSIAKKVGDTFEPDLMLRNNITTEEFPLGIYHPHQGLHHTRKENIGLIEVMGLAVLSSRFKAELAIPGGYMVDGKDIQRDEALEGHADWVEEFLSIYQEKGIPVTRDNVRSTLQEEVGRVFARALEGMSAYRCDGQGWRAFARLLHLVGFGEV